MKEEFEAIGKVTHKEIHKLDSFTHT